MASEPGPGPGGEAAHHAGYLSFCRETVIAKCASLPEPELRTPRVPSGWTPIELLHHLAMMERRWFVWGFLGEAVADPWGDSAADDRERWYVDPDLSFVEVVTLLRTGAARTDEILAATSLESVASTEGRFTDSEPPDLRWICFHVLQEYARHAGHLDIVVELAGGVTGE